MNLCGLEVQKIAHSCFRVTTSSGVIWFDPFQVPREERADIIFISHDHYDHCSPADLAKIAGRTTTIVAAANCRPKLASFTNVRYMSPGDADIISGLPVRTIPAYNLNKFRAPGQLFHPRSYGGVGFLVTIETVTLLHAGDTDATPELLAEKVDIAFLPVSGTYVMTPEEAAEAANRMGPKLAVPMHYGAIVGSKDDAEKFRKLAKVPVQVMD